MTRGARPELASAPGGLAAAPRRPLLWLALILALAAALRALGIDEPWSGIGFKSAFATVTTGCNARTFYEHGIAESGGMPFFWRIAQADGRAVHGWYAHHPALVALLSAGSLKLFGLHEWALTLPWALFSVLSVLCLYRFARAAFDERTALLAAFFLAVLPLSAWFGTIAWVDGAVIALYCELFRLYLAWLREPRRATLARAALCVFAGGLLDWSAALVLPALGLHALFRWRARGLRATLPLLALPAAMLAAMAVHKLHMWSVLGVEQARVETQDTLSWTMQLTVPLADFLGKQWLAFVHYCTWPCALGILACLALLLARVLRGRASLSEQVLLLALPPGLLYVALFPARSVNHDFFLFLSLPCFAILLARVALEIAQRAERSSASLARALVLALPALLGVWCVREVVRIWHNQRSDAIARAVGSAWLAKWLADPDAVVLGTTGFAHALPFYARAAVVPGIDSVPALEALRAQVLAKAPAGTRTAFLFDARLLESSSALRSELARLAPAELHLELKDARPPIALELYDLTAWASGAR